METFPLVSPWNPGLYPVDSLLKLGGTDDGYGFRQHHLVGAVRVQVNTGEEGGLGGMGL